MNLSTRLRHVAQAVNPLHHNVALVAPDAYHLAHHPHQILPQPMLALTRIQAFLEHSQDFQDALISAEGSYIVIATFEGIARGQATVRANVFEASVLPTGDQDALVEPGDWECSGYFHYLMQVDKIGRMRKEATLYPLADCSALGAGFINASDPLYSFELAVKGLDLAGLWPALHVVC